MTQSIQSINRRRFLQSTSAAIACGACCQLHADEPAGDAKQSAVIDIHQHINFSDRNNETLLAHQKMMGISKSILLPAGSPMNTRSTRGGVGNGLEADVFDTQAAADFVSQHSDAYAFFCNEVPDSEDAIKKLEGWLEKGAIGIGESKFHIEIDSPPMMRVYEVARAYNVPILMHFQYQTYSLGFDRMPKILEKFPTVNFIGHAQTFWANISAGHEQKVLYPKTTVVPGGLTDHLLSDYPNMFGDLSAGSGHNAMTRDMDHAAAFLQRHHKKLFFGTDCSDKVGTGDKCSGSKQLALVRQLVTDPVQRNAILFGNANRLIFRNEDE